MNLISPGIKPDLGGVLPLIVCVFHYNSQRSNPSNLITVRVRRKTSVHLQVFIADEIEGKVMFSLNSVAQQLPTWQEDGKVRIITKTNWRKKKEMLVHTTVLHVMYSTTITLKDV